MSSTFGGGQTRGTVAQTGPDLAEIQTEQLEFQAVSGEDKLRLLPNPWPLDSQPPPTASLLSVASRKGLVAAAGPDVIVVASTEALRQTYINGQAQNNIKDFEPQATIHVPRVNQVAFSSDESCMVIAAETGGGLAVYDTNALVNGEKNPAFQISTNGSSVRQLVPNPNPAADMAHYFAIVLSTGQLLLADLKARELVQSAAGGPVFYDNITCASWSRLGKQIVAGTKEGNAVQLDPKGVFKAEIPLPSQLATLKSQRAVEFSLTSICWLETNEFLCVHLPNTLSGHSTHGGDADSMEDPVSESSVFHLAKRPKPTSTEWTFQAIVDPTPAFVEQGRMPAYHYIERIREWPPTLEDMVITISSISTDIGILTKTKAPLDSQQPITDVFTTTMPQDTRRAALPVSVADEMSDTSAIGIALDLSVKEKVKRPIPTDETLDESPVPVPALYVLNHEGMLKMWWIIHNESIRQAAAYPDLIVAGGPRSLDGKAGSARPGSASSASVSSPFGAAPAAPQASPAFAAVSSMNATQPAFGSASPFGAQAKPAFGGASALGLRSSPWASASPATPSNAPADKPSFGSITQIGGTSGFGQVSVMDSKKSVWGSQQSSFSSPSASGGAPFGAKSAATGNTNTLSPFGASSTLGRNAPSPFAAAAKKDGDAASSPFGTFSAKTPASAFSSFGKTSSAVEKKEGDSTTSPFATFGSPSRPPASPFATFNHKESSSESSWQSVSFGNKPGLNTEPSGSTVSFGSTFGSASTIGQSKTPSQTGGNSFTFGQPSTGKEESMEDDVVGSRTEPVKFGAGSSGFKLGSTFKGDGSAKDDLPKPKAPGASLFGIGLGDALKEGNGNANTSPLKGPETPIKQEPVLEEKPALSQIPPAPQDSAQDPLIYKAKRFFGDLPPTDVPNDQLSRSDNDDQIASIPKEMPKRIPGDLPPMDVPNEQYTPTEEALGPAEVPLAGSPPIDLGVNKFSERVGSDSDVPPVPEDDNDSLAEEHDEDVEEHDDDGEEEEGEEEEDEEEDGGEEEIEEADDDDDDDEQTEVSDPKGLSALMNRFTPASPEREQQSESTTPATEKKTSFTPAGFPKPPFDLPPPSRAHQGSPRSPSPQRSVTAPFLKGPAAPPLPAPTLTQSNQTSPSQPRPRRIAVSPARSMRRTEKVTKPQEPDTGDLEDAEDDRIKELLQSRPAPRKDIPHFLAHQNYVGDTEKPGIGGQIEKVYRDINSMIDTFGMNAHALQGFVLGHSEARRNGARSRADLENEEEWVFGGVSDLVQLEKHIQEDLEAGKLDKVDQTTQALRGEEVDVYRLFSKASALRTHIAARSDRERSAVQQAAPLPEEARAQQAELRKSLGHVQEVMARVEDALSMLRAEISAAGAGNGTVKIPTVEAVINTVGKMTSMIQQKSAEVDILEAQIRRLPNGLSSVTLAADYEDDLASALKVSRLPNGSPQTSPARAKRTTFNGDALGMSGMLGSKYRTPPSGRKSIIFSPETTTLGRSTSSLRGSGRKKMADVTDQEVSAYETKTTGRRKVLAALKATVEKKGTRQVKVTEP